MRVEVVVTEVVKFRTFVEIDDCVTGHRAVKDAVNERVQFGEYPRPPEDQVQRRAWEYAGDKG